MPLNRMSPARSAAALLVGAAVSTGALADTTPDAASVDPTMTSSVSATDGSMEFSSALSGDWSARGDVLVKIDQERPFRVKCDFTVDSSETAFDLDGECGALFVKRPIRTSLLREGEAITGTYDADLRTGIATLSGESREGAIEMDVEWGGEVNGDSVARMRIEREGEKLRVQTIDLDPETGEEVTTSDLLLERG